MNMNPRHELRTRRTRLRGALTALSIALALFTAAPSFGIASLATEDRIDEIPVIVRGEETTYTVLRDANIDEQWYYIVKEPYLAERNVGGQTLPEMAIIRYQSKDPQNPQELIEGGLLQFSAKLSAPAETIEQLRSAIKERHPDITKPIRVAALPMKSASVRIYASDDGKMIGSIPLMSLGLSDEQIQELSFETLAAITIGGDVLELREKSAVFNGETAINTPMKDVQVVSVDGSFLTWSRVFPDSKLIFVNVGLEAGDRRVSKRLRPRNVDGDWKVPLPVYLLVDRSVDSVKADIRFGLSSGKMIPWAHSGRDLADATGSLEVTLVDGHWQEQ